MLHSLEKLADEVIVKINPPELRDATREFLQILRKRNEYQLVSSERKEELEIICLALREKYSQSEIFDFNRAFFDYNVTYCEDEAVVNPTTLLMKDDTSFMLLHPFGTMRYRNNIKAHELGHIVLNHKIDENPDEKYIEQEADFFARKLIGNYSSIRETIQTVGFMIHVSVEHTKQFERYYKDPELYLAKYLVKKGYIKV